MKSARAALRANLTVIYAAPDTNSIVASRAVGILQMLCRHPSPPFRALVIAPRRMQDCSGAGTRQVICLLISDNIVHECCVIDVLKGPWQAEPSAYMPAMNPARVTETALYWANYNFAVIRQDGDGWM